MHLTVALSSTTSIKLASLRAAERGKRAGSGSSGVVVPDDMLLEGQSQGYCTIRERFGMMYDDRDFLSSSLMKRFTLLPSAPPHRTPRPGFS